MTKVKIPFKITIVDDITCPKCGQKGRLIIVFKLQKAKYKCSRTLEFRVYHGDVRKGQQACYLRLEHVPRPLLDGLKELFDKMLDLLKYVNLDVEAELKCSER